MWPVARAMKTAISWRELGIEMQKMVRKQNDAARRSLTAGHPEAQKRPAKKGKRKPKDCRDK